MPMGLTFPTMVSAIFSAVFSPSLRVSYPTISTSPTIVSSASVAASTVSTTSVDVPAPGKIIHWWCFAGEYFMKVRRSYKRCV